MKPTLTMPIMMICYGKVSADNQRLFATSDQIGNNILPLFTDFELAEKFRSHYNNQVLEQSIPISIVGMNLGGDSADILPEQLVLYIVENSKHLRDILDLVHIAMRMVFITLNPKPNEMMLCYEMDELHIVDGNDAI